MKIIDIEIPEMDEAVITKVEEMRQRHVYHKPISTDEQQCGWCGWCGKIWPCEPIMWAEAALKLVYLVGYTQFLVHRPHRRDHHLEDCSVQVCATIRADLADITERLKREEEKK